MKGLIIYATCYGSTEQYADWICEEIPFEKKCYKEVTDEELRSAEIIILGSWVLAHKLFLTQWIESKEQLLKGKVLYAYSVSGAVPGDAELDQVFPNSFSGELLSDVKTFQCGGKREVKKMSPFHKFMMWFAVTFIEKDPMIKEKMKRYVDNVDRSYIEPLIQTVKAIHTNPLI